jgi:hypothetical protein
MTMQIDETFADSQAANAAAIKNARGVVIKRKLVGLFRTGDGALLFGDCKGSGAENYRPSADFSDPAKPVYRCTCPSRQFPCKHSLALLYAYAQGAKFVEKEAPADITEKRAKVQARVEKKKVEAEKPRKVNTSALRKKIEAQLEGLNLLESLVNGVRARKDLQRGIGRNLKNYQPSLGTIVPEKVYFYSRAQRSNNWTVIVCMDQSGSMAESVVYGSVTGSIFASLPALNTRVVAFDTEVVDLTEQCGNDPVDMIFGVQLGGGADINKAVAYCEKFITDPAQTIFFLISDLIEGGNQAQLIRRMKEMVESGVRTICLLALSDSGIPTYDERVANKLSESGVPCFGCTPNKLPELIEGVLKKHDLKALAKRIATKKEK